MGVLVNGAIGALSGVVASLIASFAMPKFALPIAILCGAAGFFVAGAVFPEPVRVTSGGRRGASSATDIEEAQASKAAKKAKKIAAEKAKKEAAEAAKAEAAKAEEIAAKAAAKKLAAKKAKAKKVAAPVVAESSESEESEAEVVEAPVEEEDESAAAPKSKSAIKKAKAKAKEAAAKAEAAAAAKAAAAAEKKNAKKKGKEAAAAEPVVAAVTPTKATPAAAAASAAPSKAAIAAEKAAAKAAAAAMAADLEGWETIEPTKPTKSQVLRAETAAVAAPAVKSNKKESIPSSERLLTEDVIIPVKHHSLIIGSNGKTLQALTTGSGATIDMPKRDSGSAKIQITGTPAQVVQARNAIESLVERGFSHLTHPGTLSDELTVDPKDVSLIIGPKGETLRTIIAKTGVRSIDLPERGSSGKKVTIVGEKEQVRAAKAALKSLIQDGFTVLTQPDWIKQEVQFPSDKFGILIGPNGQNIKSIQGNTRARINLPEKNSKSSVVTVCGTADSVAAAVRALEKMLEPLAPLPEPNDESLATDDAWGQEHTAQGEDALWE